MRRSTASSGHHPALLRERVAHSCNAYEVLFHKWVQFGRFIKAAAAAAGIIVYSKPDVEHLNESHGRFGPHDQNQQY